jgi:DNA-binding LacI/PurR family transcriptional regulator
MEMLRYIEDYLSRFGYFVNVSFSRFQETSYRKTVDLIKNKQADGFIIFPRLTSEDDEIIEYLINFNEKFVIIDRYINNDKIYQVRIDNYKAGRIAAEVLLNKGHKDFLFIWGHTDILSSHERYNGFSDRLKESGIVLTPDRQINGEFDADYTYTTVIEKFKDLPKFTAVFSSNDLSASGFIKACYINGKKPVKDYSIIGFDDDVHSRYMTPSLSTFRQPLKELGIRAAEMLIDLIEGREVSEKIVSYDALFIERESS